MNNSITSKSPPAQSLAIQSRAHHAAIAMLASLNPRLIVKLALFHIVIIACANYAMQFPAGVIGVPIPVPLGVFIFPLVILATDLTVRLSNRHNARVIVGVAYVPAIIISVWLAGWRIGFASGCAYLAGQLLDITVFQKIRERSQRWWPAPLISSVFANIIDTYLFYAVAFHAANSYWASHWVLTATYDLTFKIGISILLFLPAYGILLSYLKTKLTAD